jgi:hypothetical protein
MWKKGTSPKMFSSGFPMYWLRIPFLTDKNTVINWKNLKNNTVNIRPTLLSFLPLKPAI